MREERPKDPLRGEIFFWKFANFFSQEPSRGHTDQEYIRSWGSISNGVDVHREPTLRADGSPFIYRDVGTRWKALEISFKKNIQSVGVGSPGFVLYPI